MGIHINAKPGEIAETVFLTGDPLRAEHVAQNHLTRVSCINKVRGMLGFTGEYQGKKVTVHGVGMGMPSMAIYATELIRDYGVKQLIRLGTAGALQPQLKLGDFILAISACTDSKMNEKTFGCINFTPVAHYALLKKAEELFSNKAYVGPVLTTDTFYENSTIIRAPLIQHGVLAVEMETAALYTVAMHYGVKALSILEISDHVLSGESMPASEREQAFINMVDKILNLCSTDADPI